MQLLMNQFQVLGTTQLHREILVGKTLLQHQADQVLGKIIHHLLALAGLTVHQAQTLIQHQVGIDPFPVGLNWINLN